MSFGSISREAHTTLAIAMNRIGGFVHVPGADVVSIVDMTTAWEMMLALLVDYHRSLLSKRRRAGDRPIGATIHHPPRYLRPGAYGLSR